MKTLPYLRELRIKDRAAFEEARYPFDIPAVRAIEDVRFAEHVTILVGENGSGKSTLLEAIAVAMGFNPEGGSSAFQFETRASHSPLHEALRPIRSALPPKDGFFLRAESFYNVATNIEELGRGLLESYGGVSLHEQSHGEAFLALFLHRFRGEGLYLLDEPESALSPSRQLALLVRMHDLAKSASQLILATHSPLLMAYPGARIYHLDEAGLREVAYEDTEHFRVTRAFLDDRETMLGELFSDEA